MSVKTKLTARSAAFLAAAVGALALTGCAEDQTKGYVMAPNALQQVPVGSSQEQVLVVLGTPSTTATLKGEVYYYISQKTHRPVAFMNPKITDQQVVAVYFDQNRKVQRVANYGMQDGKLIDYVTNTTPTAGEERNFIEHMFRGLLSNDE
ncbi:outer membrane protein assembly factor BamE [Chelatococcus sambhunathii]|uniref:Outer membrane protein assembly factor BamE n=1 Tax=Chelatococcus sambhunathii TaxID=363953 RepID=A0ABU1DDK0_9HYPH|nr:outer membrane protein assembly factor BamE [Chelatococcus sambhunathii]MDR4306152.1 outer membrane protein assembly factor BamE [Chelatococcus sambhunathii]